MEEAFSRLKDLIAEDVRLAFPDYGPEAKPLQLFVDSSGIGSGACLNQVQGDEPRIIAYASTTFSQAERAYSTIERELAGLRWAVKNLRPFILGSKVEIFTDHQPLVYLHNMQILDCRLARTLEDLSAFDYEIIYLPGRDNVVADLLSRLPTEVPPINVPAVDPQELPEGVYLMKTVPGGGDSLFDSLHLLSEQLDFKRGPCKDSIEMRKLLVGEML